ncbi:hypothetical protein PCANC_06042 [Puccinia coronata f. sp. avenae]|uniref:Uncharacterized protein n=1 Tax=Puccinia coronata f. sp. avenae TaxID=200324 RepID=A0A2N5T557_9BASI|nr:hypothetical protein PCANC_06042 [Puccinia coronata f. sp. avenae]
MEWSNTSALHPIPKEASLDLKKWLWSLEKYHSTTLIPDPDPTDVGWYGNTLTSYGLGVLIGKYWAKFELKDRYIRNAPMIAWLETLAVRVGLMMLERLGISKGKKYLVRTDNSTMLAAIQQRKSKDDGVNAKWKVIQEILIAAQIDLYPLRVNLFRADPEGALRILSSSSNIPSRRAITSIGYEPLKDYLVSDTSNLLIIALTVPRLIVGILRLIAKRRSS